MVHGDLKPHNIVKISLEETWKLIDLATATEDRSETPVHHTLRCLLFASSAIPLLKPGKNRIVRLLHQENKEAGFTLRTHL